MVMVSCVGWCAGFFSSVYSHLFFFTSSHRIFQCCFDVDFWAIVCETVRPMLSGRCLSVLSVTVYCGQPVGWIEIKLDVEVGLSPGHIVLDGDPVPPPQKGLIPHFRPCLLWPNGWMDEDAAWYGGRPWPRPHCVTWGRSSPKKGALQP